MLAANPFAYLITPIKQWQYLSAKPLSSYSAYLLYPVLMAILPAVAWYYGVTEIGWQVAGGETVKLTRDSALPIIVLFYLAMITSITIIGCLTHWMSQTYEAETNIAKGISLIGFICTPLFLAGLIGFYPVLWINMVIGIASLSWALYLLYVGVPIVMRQPKERGFLYASAIVAIALVMLISIMGSSVILWDVIAPPVFTD